MVLLPLTWFLYMTYQVYSKATSLRFDAIAVPLLLQQIGSKMRRRLFFSPPPRAVPQSRPHPAQVITKTSLMLGVGETPADVEATLRDLRAVGCDVVTFGQYLRPSKRHMPMKEYVTPEAFAEWQRVAEVRMGRPISAPRRC